MTRAKVDPSVLEQAIGDAVKAGLLLHCWAADTRHQFTSEDPEERALAASECVDCPVLAPCRAEGRRHRFGVWGGRDLTPTQADA